MPAPFWIGLGAAWLTGAAWIIREALHAPLIHDTALYPHTDAMMAALVEDEQVAALDELFGEYELPDTAENLRWLSRRPMGQR